MLTKSKPSKMINRLKAKEPVEDATEVEPTGVLYVGHLPYGFVEEGLKEYFGQYGEVVNVKLGRSKKVKKKIRKLGGDRKR
jgi:RNA recognition motif-containing protein